MRRFIALPFAALVALATAAPTLAGPNVGNFSGGGDFVAGSWSGENLWGYVELVQENGLDGEGFLYEEFGTYIECPAGGEGDAAIADAPGEGFYGFVGTRVDGYAHGVDIALSRTLDSGTATGTVDLWIQTVDECAGTWDGTFLSEAFSASLAGAGSLVKFRGTGSHQIPSEFNGHSSYRGQERSAVGSLTLAPLGDPIFDSAFMSQYAWQEHTNS